MSHRRTIAIAASVAALALAAAAPQALAGPLLSGYGGPGQGNQELLGATLIGGSSGGGGGSAAGQPASVSIEAAPARAAATASGSSSGAGHGQSAPAARRTPSASPQAAPRRASEPAAILPGASDTGYGVSTAPLGITGADLVYILLSVGGLLLAGMFTRQVARRPQ